MNVIYSPTAYTKYSDLDDLHREYTVKNLRSFAGSKVTPLKTLKLLLQHGDSEVHSKAMANPNLTWVVLKPELEKILAGVASGNISPAHNRWELRLLLSKTKIVPDAFWLSMLNHSDLTIRWCAISCVTSSKLLAKVNLDCLHAKITVASNIHTSAAVLSALFDGVSEDAPDMMLSHWNVATDNPLTKPDLYREIASNRRTPETILVKMFEANISKFVEATSVTKGVFFAQFRDTPNLMTMKHSFTLDPQNNPSVSLPVGALIAALIKNPSLPSAILKPYDNLSTVKRELDSRGKKNRK